MASNTHELFSRPEDDRRSSDRSFGLVMAAAFGLLALINVWHLGRVWPWTGGLAALFLVFALIKPSALGPLNWIWFRFGLLLHKVVNPIVMAVVFYGAVLPTGLAMRALGKDPLRLKRQPEATSYWIERNPAGPSPESMRDQF